jgi:predicted membrane protein
MSIDRNWLSPRVVIGVCIILLGLAFTFDNFGVPLGHSVRTVLFKGWPLLLVIAGLARLAESRDLPGFLWVMFGAALLMDNFDLIALRRLWPLGLVMAGAFLVWRAFVPPCSPRVDVVDRVDALAFMGGTRRAVAAQDFRGGNLIAVMGGVEVDLRNAAMPSGVATLETFAMWGGIEITVPRDWQVVSRGVPLLGGFEDSTHPPDGDPATRPRLVVSGLAIMGGVEIKN